MAQRLSGGVASALESVTVALNGDGIMLDAPSEDACLLGEAAERRLRQLAQAMGLEARIARRE